MEEIFNSLYPQALKIGISVFDYWNYTLQEILDLFDIYREKKEEEAKATAANNYSLAYMVAIFSNRADQGKQPPTLHQIYPSLFEENPSEEQAKLNQIMLIKEQMLDFAENHNKGG